MWTKTQWQRQAGTEAREYRTQAGIQAVCLVDFHSFCLSVNNMASCVYAEVAAPSNSRMHCSALGCGWCCCSFQFTPWMAVRKVLPKGREAKENSFGICGIDSAFDAQVHSHSPPPAINQQRVQSESTQRTRDSVPLQCTVYTVHLFLSISISNSPFPLDSCRCSWQTTTDLISGNSLKYCT